MGVKMDTIVFVILLLTGILLTILGVAWRNYVFTFLAVGFFAILLSPVLEGLQIHQIKIIQEYNSSNSTTPYNETKIVEDSTAFQLTSLERSALFLIISSLLLYNLGFGLSLIV